MMIYSASIEFEGSALHARTSKQILLYVSPLDRLRPLVPNSSCGEERHYIILKNSSFRG